MKYLNELVIFLCMGLAHCNLEEDKNNNGGVLMDQPSYEAVPSQSPFDAAGSSLPNLDVAGTSPSPTAEQQEQADCFQRQQIDDTSELRSAEQQRALLLIALNKGNVEDTRKLIEEGVDITTPFEDSYSPLQIASIKSKELVELLLAKDVPLEARNNIGETAFRRACMFGKRDAATSLLEKGANINAADELHGYSALHGKISERNLTSIMWLLRNGASLDAVDHKGRSPFDYALTYESDRWGEIVRTLIEYGADISPPKYNPANIFEAYWESCFKIPQSNFDNFDAYVFFMTKAFLKEQSEDEHSRDYPLSTYAKNSIFALYRILKATYPEKRMKRKKSRLESAKIIFVDILTFDITGIRKLQPSGMERAKVILCGKNASKNTGESFLEKPPLKMKSYIPPERISWKIERLSFYLALISVNRNYADVREAFTSDEINRFIEDYISND